MFANFKELYRYRELTWIWILREIRVRYKQSLLGVAWAILQPLSMMLIFTLVFSKLARLPSDGVPYPIFSYSALLPWTLFSTSISFGVSSLINNLNLVVKTYFPREILPLGSIGASFFDFLVASTIFVVMMTLYKIPFSWNMVWLPVILLIQMSLTLGVALLGAALNVLYRDVRFIVPLGLQLWLYATPIIYPMSIVPPSIRPLYLLNPMAGIINAYRQILLHGEPPLWNELWISSCVALAVLILGYLVFKRLEVSFADII